MLVLMWRLFAVFQLYRASVLFETIRHETQLSTDYKLSLFDLQTSSYQALQRVLVSLGDLNVLSFGVYFGVGISDAHFSLSSSHTLSLCLLAAMHK